ncbi:MAG: hypothetical protein H0X62_03700 [Bacteroidetes bacterium]|nr:hypothetical protein [Bacteroidota bacterium]
MKLTRAWLLTALLYFLIIAVLGLLMRYLMIYPLPGFNFKYILHAHSHVALLGWLFFAIFIGFIHAYLPDSLKSGYRWLFVLFNISVVGMLVTFPFQGYALYSITFSTMHILLSYYLIYKFLKDLKIMKAWHKKHNSSLPFVKAALFFLAISTIGPWSLGIIMAKGFSGSDIYYLAVYYYLHFFYNGFLIFSVIGLFYWFLEHKNIKFNRRIVNSFYKPLLISCILTFALSVLWTKPAGIYYFIAASGAVMQVLAFFYFYHSIKNIITNVKESMSEIAFLSLKFAFVIFALKIAVQVISALPFFADLAYQQKNLVIGYLHLVLIGIISAFLFGFFSAINGFSFSNLISKSGIMLFWTGFIATELMLFAQPLLAVLKLPLPTDFYQLLFTLSILMPLGLLGFFIGQFLPKKLAETSETVTVEASAA